MNKKKLIIISIVIAVLITAYVVYRQIKKRSSIRSQAEQRATMLSQIEDTNTETYTDVDGTVVSKTSSNTNDDIRSSSNYIEFYENGSLSKALTIRDAFGFFNDNEQGIYNTISSLNGTTLLAVRDRLCNDFTICSLEDYLKDGLSSDEYNHAIELINQARKR